MKIPKGGLHNINQSSQANINDSWNVLATDENNAVLIAVDKCGNKKTVGDTTEIKNSIQALEQENIEQDNRLTDIESENIVQYDLINDLQTSLNNKLHKGTYTGTAQDLKNDIDNKTSNKYNDEANSIANDIIKLIDINTGENVNYRETTTWYDGTSMNDSKVDGVLYTKKGSKYYRRVIDKDGELFLEKDTMAQMRDLTPIEILCLKAGVYKGVNLNGYYAKGDTPSPIIYYLSDTTAADDGGSVFEVGGIKLEHKFVGVCFPEYFGAKGDGVINDTLAIQRCLNYKATNVVFAKEKYLIDNIYIDGKFGCKIKGSQIILSDRTDIDLGIEIRSNAWLDITGFQIKGNNSNVSNCRGIYSNSGNQLININIYDNEIDLCSLGISLNSDLGGDLRDCNVFRNKITNILGVNTGYGYGIHVSNKSYAYNTNVNIYDNYIYNCERHAIYMARGRGYKVYNNNINDHRKNILDSSPKAAIDISRVSNVECHDNKVVNCNGCAIMVTGDLLELLSRVENINIYNNHLESKLLSTLWIGYIAPEMYSELNGINVKGNTIIYNGSETAQSVEFRHGKNVMIEDNIIISNSRGLALESMSDTYSNNYSDAIIIDNNIFKTISEPIRIGLFGASTASLTITDSNSYGNSTTLFDVPNAITNPNISFFDKKNRIAGLPFASNISLKESLIANSNYFGLVKKSSAVADVSTTPPSQLGAQTVTTIQEAQTAINNLVSMVNAMQVNEVELKTKLNEKLTADRASGQQA